MTLPVTSLYLSDSQNLDLKNVDLKKFTDEQIISMFLSICERSKYTLRNYTNAFHQFKQFIAPKTLQDATWREIEAFKIGLMKGLCSKSSRPQAPATVSNLIAPLRSLYRWGSDPNIGLFAHNPTTCIRSPKVRVNSSQHYLTKKEVARLFEQLHLQGERDYLVGVTLVLLGLRVSELVAIRVGDFHTDPLEVSMWLTVVYGKGGKQREVKVPQSLWNILHGFILKTRRGRQQHLFPISVRQVERIIQTAREQIGLEKKLTPHWLRHTNATLALLNGASIQQVQEMLGHAQINTTQRYIHTVEQIKKAASDYVEDCLKEYIL